ncbi:hypothetical protein Ddye_031739 [Dipteronia dyeriana]|uniref:Uncharacterized protein n=1 Tax=Dipteronia dyeriana TaxID=168575 RepID=A0AAD9WNR9_9ROSI|nr:hypothetical protein Ddye_031739 [Dipteronia dyeriana]
MCPSKKPSILDVNVPSITIPSLRNSTTLTRTVTNVGGDTKSIYKAAIESPRGIIVCVNPEVLVYDTATKKISYRVTVSTTYQVNTVFFFGSLTWTNGIHAVHIVYLGERQQDDPKFVIDSHHEMLAKTVGSKEEASKLMVYNYKHGFSGFAAKLTEPQAQKLSEIPGVVRVIPNSIFSLQTTRSWDFLGLSADSPNNLLYNSKLGEGSIIGLLDTGIWPESESFSDEGLGPVPSSWKGTCESGDRFNATVHCNRKIIGARWFVDGLLAEYGKGFNMSGNIEFFSPRDADGHGTHTSSTAAGAFVKNVNYKGLGNGVARGGAPLTRLAIYKVCWNVEGGQCAAADILKAFDEAIHDGVDVISVSIASEIPLLPEVDQHNAIATGAFHAVAKGIPVVCAAGNDGPTSQTVQNTAPWILTVAASSTDRAFPTPITLGNNKTLTGQSTYTGKTIDFTGIVYLELDEHYAASAEGKNEALLLNATLVAGKVVLVFPSSPLRVSLTQVKAAGAAGVLLARNPAYAFAHCIDDFACIEVSPEVASRILLYARSTRFPVVKVLPSSTFDSKLVSPKVAIFSARGPNSIAHEILKPDIAAPGVNILAATSPISPFSFNGFDVLSGTSMSTPHVSGIVALLKLAHPDWSPAAIKSALVTTAWKNGRSGSPISAQGSPIKLADPFDFGGGIVNPNEAAYPGLVYDMTTDDYIHYLCAMNYNNYMISGLVGKQTMCPSETPSILDVNVPSITISSLMNSTIVLTRTVTNVGYPKSIYKAVIEPPVGIVVSVKPEVLVFDPATKKISYRVAVSTTHQVNTGYYFGSLTWTDGIHAVRIPLSVHIVYLGERKHDDPKLVIDSHHEMLAKTVGSKEEASKLMVHNYKHGFSGFAAKLTESQAQKLSETHGVVRVIPNSIFSLQTTRSWDFLGLSADSPNNLLYNSKLGEGSIIGLLDTGIWPESEAFNDEGLGPVPSSWKGTCESGDRFNATVHCNRKIIGARWFIDGLLAEYGKGFNMSGRIEFFSPRDVDGHGTHTSSTAGGAFVKNVNYQGVGNGVARGGAPLARLAMYKVCWNIAEGGHCAAADILKAFDEAIHDGVHVISISMGSKIPLLPEVDQHNAIATGSFHAVAKGIPVVCAAGNDGPTSQTVMNTAPWILTVAASSTDRAFPTPITLGNNKTLTVNILSHVGKLSTPNPVYASTHCIDDFACIEVSPEVASQILLYARSTRYIYTHNVSYLFSSSSLGLPSLGSFIYCHCFRIGIHRFPVVKVLPSSTFDSKLVSPKVAIFSSRGPNSIAHEILKPDIAAPGVNILAATSPISPFSFNGFDVLSGTSMATPHVSGIVALLKLAHPDWSPAAIKSALVTTAWKNGPSGSPISAQGSPIKLADPFDFGGGIVNPNEAADPGLVYDMTTDDYIHYLCAMNYNNYTISGLVGKQTMCPSETPSVLDVNVPSITISSLMNSTIVLTRTVTNVGYPKSVYKAVIEPPVGIIVSVKPEALVFDTATKKMSYRVAVSTTHQVNTGYYFGSLTWTDGIHHVRIPLSVRTKKTYADN